MNEFQQAQFVLLVLGIGVGVGDVYVRFRPDDKKEGRVASVDGFVASVFNKGALELGAREAFADDLRFERDAFFHWEPLVIFRTPGLSLFVSMICMDGWVEWFGVEWKE